MGITIDEAIEHGKEQLELFGGTHRESIKMEIEALEQEPSGNAINRQAVLDIFNKSDEYSWEMSLLRKKIEKMPPVITHGQDSFTVERLSELSKAEVHKSSLPKILPKNCIRCGAPVNSMKSRCEYCNCEY